MKTARAQLSDVTALAHLHARAFPIEWPEEDFIGHIENPLDEVIVSRGKTNDDLRGFIIVRSMGNDSEILTIAVQEAARKQGIGGGLVEAGLAHAKAKAAHVMFLEVGADNSSAIGLYEAKGFYRYGTRPRYYKRPGGRVDAYLFQKCLKSLTPD